MRYYHLPIEMGAARADDGSPVAWVSCPDLPGAYEEAPTPAEARARLRALARRIIAEHLLRDDPLEPSIVFGDAPALAPSLPDLLTVPVSDADIEEVRQAPLLIIEQPEP